MIPNYSMIPAAAIGWSPGIWWSPAIRWSPDIRWSIRSMDFDKPKIYGDTSITDGLVLYIELNDLWPKKICKPKMIVWSDATFILRWSCFIWAFHLLQKQGWTKTFVQNCKHGQRQKGMRVGCFAKLQTVTKYLQFQIYVSNINSMLLAVIELPPTLSSVLQTWKSATEEHRQGLFLFEQ